MIMFPLTSMTLDLKVIYKNLELTFSMFLFLGQVRWAVCSVLLGGRLGPISSVFVHQMSGSSVSESAFCKQISAA